MLKPIFFSILYFAGILRLSRFINRHKAVILLYHGVCSRAVKEGVRNSKHLHIELNKFKRQMRYLKKNYRIIPLETLCAMIKSGKRLPAYIAVVTFDDGYRNVFDNAYPLLRDCGIPASFFLTDRLMLDDDWLWADKLEYMVDTTGVESADIFGQVHSLKGKKLKVKFLNFVVNRLKSINEAQRDKTIEELSLKLKTSVPRPPCDEYRLMNFEQARQMRESGLISFGAHTSGHTILPLEDAEKIGRIIFDSKREITEQLQGGVDSFAYPNGSYDDRIKQILKEYGFSCALTTEIGFNGTDTGLFELKRISVGAGDSLIPFIAHLSGVRWYTSCFMDFLRRGFG